MCLNCSKGHSGLRASTAERRCPPTLSVPLPPPSGHADFFPHEFTKPHLAILMRNVPHYRTTFRSVPTRSGFSLYYKLAVRNPEATAIFSFSLCICTYVNKSLFCLILAFSCPLEKEMATHSSIIAWRIPGMGEPGGLLSLE